MIAKNLLLLFSSLFILLAVQAQFNKDYVMPSDFFLSLNPAGSKVIQSDLNRRTFFGGEKTVFLTHLDSTVSNKTVQKTLFQKVNEGGTNFGTLLFTLTQFPKMRLNALVQKRDKGYLLVGTDGDIFEQGLYILSIDSQNNVIFSTHYSDDIAINEAFGIHRTNDFLEQYIITGHHNFFGEQGLFTTKITSSGNEVWSTTHKILANSFGNPTSVYNSEQDRVALFSLLVTSNGKPRIFAFQIDDQNGAPLGSGKKIEVVGLDSLLGFSCTYSSKTNKYYLVYKGKGDSVGINKEGLFLTEFNNQLQPISTRQFFVPNISKLEPTGVVVISKGSAGTIDSLDIALKEIKGNNIFNPAVLSIKSNGVLLSYTRIKPINSTREKTNTSSIFLSGENIFINGLTNKNTTKLVKLPKNLTATACTQSVTGITNKLFSMSTFTNAVSDVGGQEIIGNPSTATVVVKSVTPIITDCSDTGVPKVTSDKLSANPFSFSPTLFQNGQKLFTVNASHLIKQKSILTLSDGQGITRMQKILDSDSKRWQLTLPSLTSGLYYVTISNAENQVYKTTIIVE